jgi:hypothetical protein
MSRSFFASALLVARIRVRAKRSQLRNTLTLTAAEGCVIDSLARDEVFATGSQGERSFRRGLAMSDEKKRLNRRSFMSRVAGAAVIAGGATAIVTGEAAAQNYTGRTDGDSGSYADRAGYGRTGITDGDSGSGSDRAGYGRGGGGSSGCSDSDSGTYADPGGQGRRCGGGGGTGYTDSDSGAMADPAGNGRGPRRSASTGLTDADSGSTADNAGYGRGSDR